MAAKELSERGHEVLILEAGPEVEPTRDFAMNKFTYESMYRGFGPPGWRQKEQWMQDTAGEFSRHFYVNDTEHPYTTDPGKPFLWVRARVVGGKTLHWGRLSWRLSDLDFKAATRDGFDVDWPIDYDEIKKYYDKAEEWIGVSGNRDNLWWLPDGNYLPPMGLNCGEHLLKKGAAKLGINLIQPRVAMLTAVKPHHAKYGRAKCHFCGSCGNGCSVGAMFNSLSSTLPAAMATKNCTLRTNSIVRHIVVDENTGKAKGVAVVDRVTRQELEFFGKVIIVAASTLESTRILLNSKSRQHPNGLGNSSGVLGHYLMDHMFQISAGGVVPALKGTEYDFSDGRANGIYVPRFRNISDKHTDFIRGYGMQGGCRQGYAFNHARQIPGFGSEFKKLVRDNRREIPFWLGAWCEMLPRKENRVTIDPKKVDAWGIPALHIECTHGDNERAMARDALEAIKEMVDAARFITLETSSKPAPP